MTSQDKRQDKRQDQSLGIIISGTFDEVIARKRHDALVELGELVIARSADAGVKKTLLLQVTDTKFSSQLSQENMELVAGMNLEEDVPLTLLDANIRTYEMLGLKPVLELQKESNGLIAKPAKTLPSVFSSIFPVTEQELSFFNTPLHPLHLGFLRSGSRTLKTSIFINGLLSFSHHILIAGTTGKGKSILMSDILWNAQDQSFVSLLVLDPHDEYYGRNSLGLKDHPSRKIAYYTSRNVPAGQHQLKINLKSLRVEHFDFLDLSPPQRQAMYAYAKKYGNEWVEAAILEKPIEVQFHDATLGVLKRRLLNLLDIDYIEDTVKGRGVFDFGAGESTGHDICALLENGKSVIIDTSAFSGQVELLIGSVISHEILSVYKHHKLRGELDGKPVVSVVLEEAPRVLGKDVLAGGNNVYAQICREGRKFNVGLIAITQLPSLIPKELLANMNTKIIMGIEMASERQAIIESASQDLSAEVRMIASLNKGEALVTSSFLPFAVPISVPFFPDLVKERIGKSGASGTIGGQEKKLNFSMPELKD